MPSWLHILIIVLFTVYFIFKYVKDRYLYELIFIVWAPSTLLTYLITNRIALLVLGILQVICFVVIIFLMFKKRDGHLKQTYKKLAEINANAVVTEETADTQAIINDEKNNDSAKNY